ncbi:MAG TPA: glycine cleavage system protein H [Phaeodactylibacter sp.]|nr:glycine cleavage system protein H [Phaeodactylibacter sp.]
MKKIGNYFIDTSLYYDTHHNFWLKENNGFVRIGFHPLLQESSGSFVAIVFENENQTLSRGQTFGSVEAEKHVAQLLLPISGKIICTNDKVIENPRLLNTDPYGEGWLVEVESTDFQHDKSNLISGEQAITDWILEEIKKYEDKGWIARP